MDGDGGKDILNCPLCSVCFVSRWGLCPGSAMHDSALHGMCVDIVVWTGCVCVCCDPAGALAEDPKLLLLDELTTFLDVEDQFGVLQAVKSITHQRRNVTAVWVTHR